MKFGNVGTGTIATRSLSLHNVGKGVLSGEVEALGLPPQYSLSVAGPFRLPHGSRLTATIQFAPQSVGQVPGAIVVLTGDPKHPSVSVPITAAGVSGTLSVAKSLNFGAVTAGQSRTMTLAIKNLGLGVLHGTVGTLIAPFAVTSGGTFTLEHGQHTGVTIQFSPMTKGAAMSQILAISSDDSADPELSVKVGGTGK